MAVNGENTRSSWARALDYWLSRVERNVSVCRRIFIWFAELTWLDGAVSSGTAERPNICEAWWWRPWTNRRYQCKHSSQPCFWLSSSSWSIVSSRPALPRIDLKDFVRVTPSLASVSPRVLCSFASIVVSICRHIYICCCICSSQC